MGSTGSTARDDKDPGTPGDEKADATWPDDAWNRGMPFSLLTDEAYVNEKFQELKGCETQRDDHTRLEMTGNGELPLSELERISDGVRIKLFAAPPTKSGDSVRPQKPAGVLEVIKDTVIDRVPCEKRLSDRRQHQRCEVVRDYMARLADRLASRSREVQGRVATRKQVSETTQASASERFLGFDASHSASDAFFKVSSFRMQLEMLHGFRTLNPRVFERGVSSLLQTVLDFPPLVLLGADRDAAKIDQAVAEVLINDLSHFCEELAAAEDLSMKDRDLLLVIYLALGVCCGQSKYLVKFAMGALRRKDKALSRDDAAFGTWVGKLLQRLEGFRVKYSLGTLTEDSQVKQINVKLTRDEGSELDQTNASSIAADGTYVFVWNNIHGLQKIGSGSNFSVAGRVYATAPVSGFYKHLRERKTLQAALYGRAQDVTGLIKQAIRDQSSSCHIGELMELGGLKNDSSSQLFVVTATDSGLQSGIFGAIEDLPTFLESSVVQLAFFGEFEVALDDRLQQLQRTLTDGADSDNESLVVVDDSLLHDLFPSPTKKADPGSEMLTVLHSSRTTDLAFERLAYGDTICGFEDRSHDIYHSSLVCCQGRIYLSLLYPIESSQPDQRSHRPRQLLEISVVDLTVQGIVELSAGDADESTGIATNLRIERPLFTYASEGQRLYEVELSADRFRVRMFGVKDSAPPAFIRSLDLDVKKVQCATFVGCLLKLLKAELRVGDYDFELPTLFTNGSFMWVALPSITSALDKAEGTGSRRRFDCLLFNCETGAIVDAGAKDPVKSDGCTFESSPSQFKSFERVLPGSRVCFDATNNIIWLLSFSVSTLFAYRNNGRRIPVADEDSDAVLAVRNADSGTIDAESAATRVLSFVAKYAEGGGEVNDRAPAERGLDNYLDQPSFQLLISLSNEICGRRRRGGASATDLYRLRYCLSVLRCSVDNAVRGHGIDTDILDTIQAELPVVVAGLIEYQVESEIAQGGIGSSMEARLVSTALSLNASLMQVIDTSIEKQVQRVYELVGKWKTCALSTGDLVIAASLLRQLRQTLETSGDLSSSIPADVWGKIQATWESLVHVQCARVKALSRTNVESVHPTTDLESQLMGLMSFILQSALVRALDDEDTLRFALGLLRMACTGLTKMAVDIQASLRENASERAIQTIEAQVDASIIRSIGPTILSTSLLVLREWNTHEPMSTEMQAELGSFLLTDVGCIQELFKSLSKVVTSLHAESKTTEVPSVKRTTRTEVMESAHEYGNDLDVTTKLEIPGATRMTITFDARSRTEMSYDYLTFYTSTAHNEVYGERYYCGRDGEHNWPGVDGNPPLVIDSDHCFVYFHTDASNTDWGYKFTAVGDIIEHAVINQHHWLSTTAEMALSVLNEVAKLLVNGTQLLPIMEGEALSDGTLRSGLLRHGSVVLNDQAESVVKLLRDFVQPPEGSDAARVLQAIETKAGQHRLQPKAAKSAFVQVPSGDLSSNPINVAVRATAAAILHHNMWGMDAYALAQQLRADVSEQLLRGWRNAQKMRQWFHLGDAARDVSDAPSPSGPKPRSGQPSAYKGMTDEAMHIVSRNIVDRATFLLEIAPMAFAYVSGAKRRWDFLDKYGTALSDAEPASDASDNYPLDKWYHLLDELQGATELRSLLNYRRSSSERRKAHQTKNVTEQVLEFLQSDIDVAELRNLIKLRNLRAEYRASGFRVFREMLATASVPRFKLQVVESCSEALRALAVTTRQTLARMPTLSTELADALPPSRVHFGTLLSGCESQMRKEVNESFGAYLAELLLLISEPTDSTPDELRSDLIVSVMKAICLDYDVDDTYLLHDCNVLPTQLQLLGSNSCRIQRAAQTLLEVFLSRLIDNKERGDEADTVTLFQKHLFATVGLQLEGIASRVRELSAGNSHAATWSPPMFNLARSSAYWTVPVSRQSDLRWNHSIMLWLYVPSTASLRYALKIGDEVRPGPSWPQDDSTGTSANEIGVVTAIPSPTSVSVKWSTSEVEADYVFDPKHQKMEVILAEDSVAGVIFCKGTKSLVKDTGKAFPWSHFGLYLNDQRQLSYKIGCGADKECSYDTNFELETDEWAHVAIVQNEDVLKFYVNGLLVTQSILDPFLSLKGVPCPMESRIVESPHPTTESADQYWSVHIPGATKIRIVFDPLCDIDQAAGFVRFYKDARCQETWGEDKYTGRYHDPERNFPGALSNRHRGRRSLAAASSSQALEIPCDRVLVYFSHTGESCSWGFRLLATPEFASAKTSLSNPRPRLSNEPFSIGEPPSRVVDEPAAKCWITQPEIVPVPLDEDAIVEEMQGSCPTSITAPDDVPVEQALLVLGMLRTCTSSRLGRDLLASRENIRDLLTIAFDTRTPVEVRCGGILILKDLCQSSSADDIRLQVEEAIPDAGDGCSFVKFVFDALATAVNVWARSTENLDDLETPGEEELDHFEEDYVPPPCPLDLQTSAADALALTSAYTALLRSLARSDDWSDDVARVIETALSRWQGTAKSSSRGWVDEAGDTVAAIHLLGGDFGGTAIGRRVQCCASIDGKETIETGYLIRLKISNDARAARVLFDCDPLHPIDVPVSDVAYYSDEDEKSLDEFLRCVIPKICGGSLEDIFGGLLRSPMAHIPSSPTAFKPKTTKREHVEVLESEHPYRSGEDVIYPLHFHGAREIVIYFDQHSSTACPDDYVAFFKRDDDNRVAEHRESFNGKSYWGEERYFGTIFPGVNGKAPLRIPGSSVDVIFRTAPSRPSSSILSDDWGFKLSAHAFEETLTYAPEFPPAFATNATADIRSRALKVLHSCIRALPVTAIHPITPVIPSIVTIANELDTGRPTQCSPKKQIFESKHPYANLVKEYLAVTFSGAARLLVTFDSRSCTEKQNDFVSFYKDKSLTDRWGELQYSGADGEANWPGVAGRPPLVIASDSFTLLWSTDASNVEWGWKFTVVAEYPKIAPSNLRIDQLHKHAHDVWEVFYDGIGAQRTPFVEEYDGYEKITDESTARGEADSTARVLHIISSSLTEHENEEVQLSQVYRVVDDDGVAVRSSPDDRSDVLQHLKRGSHFSVDATANGWLRTHICEAPSTEQCEGWIRQRSDDRVHVVDTWRCAQDEDLLVLGVDDSPQELQKRSAMHQLDDSNSEHDKLTNFCSQYSYETLKGQMQRLQSFALDVSRALAVKYARESLATLLSLPDDTPLSLSHLGSSDMALELLMHLVYDKEDAIDMLQLEEHLQAMLTAPSASSDVFDLVEQSICIVERAVRLLPEGRGALRVIESRHPYPDDVDQYWQLAIPGADKILIYFDPRSKTESDCDWVCFYKLESGRTVKYADQNYSGRNGTENWPGCGGRPPLVIESDRAEVYFHSDASQNDWGFKLFAVGVFHSSSSKVGSSNALADQHDVDALMRLSKMGLWMLELAARACARSQSLGGKHLDLRQLVYSPRVISVVIDSLNHHSYQVRLLVLKLVRIQVEDRSLVHSIPSPLVQDLRNTLAIKLRSLSTEAESMDAKPEYLQLLTECLLFVDIAIDSDCYSISCCQEPTEVAKLKFVKCEDGSLYQWSMAPVPASQKLTIHFGLQQVSAMLQFELRLLRPESSELLLHWDAAGVIVAAPMCGIKRPSSMFPLKSGDHVTFEADLANRCLVLRKNDSCVYVSTAVASSIKSFDAFFADSQVCITIASSSSDDVVFMTQTSASPLAVFPIATAPAWYDRLCDSMSHLLDVQECREAAVVECESEHPLQVQRQGDQLQDQRSVERRRIAIKNAVALEIRFDRRTSLSNEHTLHFDSSDGTALVALTGLRGTSWEDSPGLFLADPTRQGASLRPGDLVIRSLDWAYGEEDGGPGRIGVVEEVVAWGGQNGTGVRVRWQNSAEATPDQASTSRGIYRYGFENRYDVQVVSNPNARHSPLIVKGETLDYWLEYKSSSPLQLPSVDNFSGTLRVSPDTGGLSLDLRKSKMLLGDDCTIECWLCVVESTISSSTTAGASSIALLNLLTLDPSSGLSVCASTDGRIWIAMYIDGEVISLPLSTPVTDSTSSIEDGMWNHLAIVFDSSKMIVYLNGEQHLEALLDQKLVSQSLFVSSIDFGFSSVPHIAAGASEIAPMHGHLCDVRVWDMGLRSEQIRSHAHGIDSIASVAFSAPATPVAPRKPSRKLQLAQLLPPPSPPRSPSSRSHSVPVHQRKWVTCNRTGKDLVTVRADCPISSSPSPADKKLAVYFEAHILSGGKVSIGWSEASAAPLARDALVGEYSGAVGIELPRFCGHFNGNPILELENPRMFDGMRSPRRSSSSSSASGWQADVFSRDGDVIGCLFTPATMEFGFFLNGEIIAKSDMTAEVGQAEGIAASTSASQPMSSSSDQVDFEGLVDELLTMGFSRQASEEALGASSEKTVPQAINWLLEESTAPGGRSSISSPRRLSSTSPFASPRRRRQSSNSASASTHHVHSSSGARAVFAPAASMGAQGAQGVAWNLGQRPFKYTPAVSDGASVVSVLRAANRRESESDGVTFEVFDHRDRRWEAVSHRHRIQDTVPSVIAHWRLDEGSGTTVYDASGRDLVGKLRHDGDDFKHIGPASPSSRVSNGCWDHTCLPPIAVERRTDESLFGSFTDAGSPTSSSGAVSKDESVWGFRFYVIPHFSTASIGRRRFAPHVKKLLREEPLIEPRHDLQLVKYINKAASVKQLTVSQILRAPWSDIAPTSEEAVKWRVFAELGCGPRAAEEEGLIAENNQQTGSGSWDVVAKRFKVLQDFNRAVSHMLQFIPFVIPGLSERQMQLPVLKVVASGQQLRDVVVNQRHRIVHALKRGLWDDTLERTTESALAFELTINRPKAMRHRLSGRTDTDGRYTVFSQAFRQLSGLGGGHFRRKSAIYSVLFLGENAQDAGGPYRETLAQFTEELHSSQLPLLIASSNTQHNVGAAREKWVLNPSSTSATALKMFEFLGKLMGAAMRSQEYMPMQIAVLIWKKLTGETVTTDDLALVDSMIVNSMDKIRTIDQCGVTADVFEDIVMETFTTLSTDNRTVALKPNGASIPVTFDSRIEFADLVEAYRLREFDVQIEAILRGLATVVPVHLLSLFTGVEMELMVCGSPEVDVDLLQRCTEYSSCRATDNHIVWFWEVLRAFSHEERSAFLRFVWGRSRLPANEKEFPQRFKLQSFNKSVSGSVDRYLPISHTCFFSVEMPRYSSASVLRERLLYAMYNCQEIDADGDTIAANQLNWAE